VGVPPRRPSPEIDGVVYLNDGPTDLTRPPQARQDAPLPVLTRPPQARQDAPLPVLTLPPQARQDAPLPVLTLPPQASSHPPAPSLPGQAPFHRDAPLPVPGDFVKVEITDAAAYDLVGRIVG